MIKYSRVLIAQKIFKIIYLLDVMSSLTDPTSNSNTYTRMKGKRSHWRST